MLTALGIGSSRSAKEFAGGTVSLTFGIAWAAAPMVVSAAAAPSSPAIFLYILVSTVHVTPDVGEATQRLGPCSEKNVTRCTLCSRKRELRSRDCVTRLLGVFRPKISCKFNASDIDACFDLIGAAARMTSARHFAHAARSRGRLAPSVQCARKRASNRPRVAFARFIGIGRGFYSHFPTAMRSHLGRAYSPREFFAVRMRGAFAQAGNSSPGVGSQHPIRHLGLGELAERLAGAVQRHHGVD